MATSPGIRRPHLAGSPFAPYVDRVVEQYALDDRVTHDAHGLGRVVGVDAGGVAVDFDGARTRIPTPFRKLTEL